MDKNSANQIRAEKTHWIKSLSSVLSADLVLVCDPKARRLQRTRKLNLLMARLGAALAVVVAALTKSLVLCLDNVLFNFHANRRRPVAVMKGKVCWKNRRN
jgi:hypothetical protein